MAAARAHRILAQPDGHPAPLFGRVLVGFDRGERFDDTLRLARQLVDPASGRICVCHPLDGRHGDPATVLPNIFDGVVDLVVCGSHGYGALQRSVAGSVSKSLLERATGPVLIVRAESNQKERWT